MNPLVQRLLIALGGGVAATTVVVGTAKNKNARAKKKRRKKSDPPVVIGTVAKRQAADEFVPSLTAKDVLDNIKGTSAAIANLFKKKPKVVDDGAPDGKDGKDGAERKSAGGKTVKASPKKKPLTAAERRKRRGKRRRHATLFESAKESFRQVVKEETNKVVDEKMEETGLKKAGEVLKQAGENVGSTVKEVASKVQESIPEDANEKLQAAGKSFLAGAKKLGQNLAAAAQKTAAQIQTAAQEASQSSQSQSSQSQSQSSLSSSVDRAAAIDVEVTPIEGSPSLRPPESSSSASSSSSAPPAAPAADATSSTALAPTPPAPSEALPVQEGLTAEQVGEKAKDVAKKIGAFLSGPGNPGYNRSSRIGQGGSGDVVEAKDPTPDKAPRDPQNP